MKLGTSSPLAHESAEEWAAKHRSLGLEAINFHLTCEDDPSAVDEYVKKAAKYGLVIAEVGVWRNTLDPDEEEREKAIRYAAGQLALADRIGARCCVNILGARGSRWDGAYRENYLEETWELADSLGGFDIVREMTLTCYNGIRGDGCMDCPACKLRKRGLDRYLARRGK